MALLTLLHIQIINTRLQGGVAVGVTGVLAAVGGWDTLGALCAVGTVADSVLLKTVIFVAGELVGDLVHKTTRLVVGSGSVVTVSRVVVGVAGRAVVADSATGGGGVVAKGVTVGSVTVVVGGVDVLVSDGVTAGKSSRVGSLAVVVVYTSVVVAWGDDTGVLISAGEALVSSTETVSGTTGLVAGEAVGVVSRGDFVEQALLLSSSGF